MKLRFVFMIALILSMLGCYAQKKEYNYAPTFRFCPDRDYDIAWENDLVAFRVYGLQPTADAGLSGVDCWHKRVSYPITDKWYKAHLEGISYHVDHGEGCDKYHVGKTRGCGGLGIWKDNKILRSGLYESWEVISNTATTLKFRLEYSWNIDGKEIKESRIISLENGSQLYEAESQFTINAKPVRNLEMAIGLSTQNGIAKVSFNEKEGWMYAWHTLGKDAGMIGTGAIVEVKQLEKMLEQKSEEKDDSHVIAIVKTDSNGKVKYKSGFAWDKAGKITSSKEWEDYLSKF